MKFLEVHYRKFEYSKINPKNHDSEDFIGKAITTKETEMSTGYFERGCPSRQVMMPAGTEVNFYLCQYKDDKGVYTSLEIGTCHKFDDGRTLGVKAYHRIDCTFDEAMAKFGFTRTQK